VTGSNGVTGGSRSTFTAVSSNTYDLWVTANKDTTDVRLHTTGLVLPSTGVVTLILTPTTGGVLVDGFALVQGGSLTPQRNTKARARVVGNLAGDATLSVLANSTSLTGVAPVLSPTIKPYTLVDAGSVTFHTSFNGSSLPDVTQTVAGGSDITVLVTGNDIGTAAVNVFSDDNRLPTTTTEYKIRLMHGSNVLAARALSLSVDFSELIVDQGYGAASAYKRGTPTTSAQIDVGSLASTTPVFSISSDAKKDLVAQGVYTMFIFDSAGSPTGQLRKER
jgi:hypothetical protein